MSQQSTGVRLSFMHLFLVFKFFIQSGCMTNNLKFLAFFFLLSKDILLNEGKVDYEQVVNLEH